MGETVEWKHGKKHWSTLTQSRHHKEDETHWKDSLYNSNELALTNCQGHGFWTLRVQILFLPLLCKQKESVHSFCSLEDLYEYLLETSSMIFRRYEYTYTIEYGGKRMIST